MALTVPCCCTLRSHSRATVKPQPESDILVKINREVCWVRFRPSKDLLILIFTPFSFLKLRCRTLGS